MVNPDLPPPRSVLDRLLEAVTKNTNHRYAVSRGVRRLREAFSFKYRTAFGHDLNPESEVCVCLGSKDATFHALRVLLSPGDGVIVPVPSYPAHPSAVALAGGRSVAWEASLDVSQACESLSKLLASNNSGTINLSRIKVLLLNFPNNPSGSVVSSAWWREVGRICAAHQVTILNDFVYGEMCFSGQPAASALTALTSGARCVEVYSLSKAYNVPGWRVGALVGDAGVVSAVSRLKSQADYGLFLPLQYAAAHALTATSPEELVGPTVRAYNRRARILRGGLLDLGWEVLEPSAAASLWCRFPESMVQGRDEERYSSVYAARRLLLRAGVVVTPGAVFGEACDRWVRFALVVNEERLRDVVRAIRVLSD
jgi:alanine-synthesizing transaminase